MLSVKNITKSYAGNTLALQDVSFRVESGEKCALLGINGAGKTTLFKIVMGLLAPDQGNVELEGLNIKSHLESCQRKMGYLAENSPLYPELTPHEHLGFLAKLHHIEKSKSRLEEMAEAFELQSVWSRPIAKLSKGFRQRVALAAAVIHNPPLLILDEPTSGLDPHQVDQFRKLIRSISKDKAVLLSTHILSEVEVLCSKCVILHEGIIAHQTQLPICVENRWSLEWKGEAWQYPDITVIDSHDLEAGWRRSLLKIDKPCPSDLIHELHQSGCRTREFRPVDANLEEIFLKATSK